MLNYAKKFQHCLLLRDFREVQDLKETVRPNVLKALSALARFLGAHEDFKQLVKNFSLSWRGKCAEDLIIERMTRDENPDAIFQWIRQVKMARPDLSEFVEFMAVTGLRLVEAVNSYNLIVKLSKEDKLDSYYNRKNGTLEHFRFKEVFFRRSKKAFLSFISEDLIQKICGKKLLTSPVAVQNLVRKKGLRAHFADIREAHATLMIKHLKDNEIDFLHGRVTGNVFMRNYFNPALIVDLKTRAQRAATDIQKLIGTMASQKLFNSVQR